MPASQLKQLKASLREQGVVGPQKSKKQKKQAARQGASKDKRVAKGVALDGIREKFNPFEAKTSARGSKYQFANGPGANGPVAVGRPGVTKGLGEEAVSSPARLQLNAWLTKCLAKENTSCGDAKAAKSWRNPRSQVRRK